MIGFHHRIRTFVIILICVAIIAQGLYFASYTGLFSFETSTSTYQDVINKNFSVDSSYLWEPSNTNFENINSVKISGTLYGSGNAKVYLISKSGKVLLFDSSKVSKKSGVALTGLTVDGQEQAPAEQTTELGVSEPVSDSTSQIAEQPVVSDTNNLNQDTSGMVTEPVVQTTIEPIQNDATTNELIQNNSLNVDNLNMSVIENQTNTIEQVQNATSQDIGSGSDLQPEKHQLAFNEFCVNSCYLNESEKSYTLEIVISGDLILEINSILYDVTRKQNRLPQISKIPDLEIPSQGYTLNLLDYTFDADGDKLIFSSTSLDNFDILFNSSNVTIVPHTSFIGNETVWFYVFDGINETVSYGVVLFVTNKTAVTLSNQTKTNLTLEQEIVEEFDEKEFNVLKPKFENAKIKNVIKKTIKIQNKTEVEHDIEFYDNNNLSNVRIRGIKDITKLTKSTFVDNRLSVETQITTDIFAAEITNFSNATIRLFKNGPVNTVYECKDYNYLTNRCRSGKWIATPIKFVDDGQFIEFTVNSFSGQGGGNNPNIGNITFDRMLDCPKCGKHKVPPVEDVNMTVIVSPISDLVNATLEDYYSVNWTIVNSMGGILIPYNTTFNKIIWYLGNVTGQINKTYEIKSAILSSPPEKYDFFSSLSGTNSDYWNVVVSDVKFTLANLDVKIPANSTTSPTTNISINSYPGNSGHGPIFGIYTGAIQCNGTVTSTTGNGGSAIITRLFNATDVALQKIPTLLNSGGITNNSDCANPESATLSATGDVNFTSCNYYYANFSKDYGISCNSTDAVGIKNSILNRTLVFSYDDCKTATKTVIDASRIASSWFSRSSDCRDSKITSPVNMTFGQNAFPHGSYNLTNSTIELTSSSKNIIILDYNASVIFDKVNISAVGSTTANLYSLDDNGTGHIFNNTRFENFGSSVQIARDNTTLSNVTLVGPSYLILQDCVGCDLDNSYINYSGPIGTSSLQLIILSASISSINFSFNNLVVILTTSNSLSRAITSSSDKLQLWLNDSYLNTTGAAGKDLTFSGNFTFTNVTFNKNNVDATSVASNLSVYWYLDVNVTNATGVALTSGPIVDARVQVTDNQGRLINTSYSKNNGYIPKLILKEYSENGNLVSYFLTNYTVNVSVTGPGANGCTNASYKVNLTTNTRLDANISCVILDTTPPNLTLKLPRNITYNNNFSIEFNFTPSNDFASCWYTLNGGASVNISCLGYNSGNALNVSGEGGYNLIVFANDSLGNINFTGVNFTVSFCSGQENWVIDGMGGIGNASVSSLVCENKTIMLNENLTIKNYGNLTFRNITLIVNNTAWNNTLLVDNFGNFSILSNIFYGSKINGTGGGGDYRFVINNSRFFIKDSFIYNAGVSGEMANSSDEGIYVSNGNLNFINTSVQSFLEKNGTSTILIVNSSNVYFYGVTINKTGLYNSVDTNSIVGRAIYLNNVSNSNFTDVVVNLSLNSRGIELLEGSNNNTFDRVIINSNFTAFYIINSIENKIYNSVVRVIATTPNSGKSLSDGIRISNANNTVFKNLTASKVDANSLQQLFRSFAPMTYNLTIYNSFFDIVSSNSGFIVTSMNSTYISNSNFTNFANLFSSATAGTSIYMLNSTFRRSINLPVNATVAWFFNVNVTDANGIAINGVNSTLYDKNTAFVFSDLTNSNGLTPLENVTEYTSGGVGAKNVYTNHTLITNYSNYPISNISINITNSMTQNIVFDFNPTLVNITIFPKSPVTTDNLNCTFLVLDNDTSAKSISINATWYKDGIFIASYNIPLNNGTGNSTILTFSNTTKNENWTCSITPYDGLLYGPQRNASVIIQNSAPSAVTLNWPTNANYNLINRTVNFTWNAATDADNDLIIYDMFLECFSACSDDSRVIYNISSASYRFSADIKYLRDITPGTYYNWTVRSYDNTSYGPNSTTFNFSIASSVIVSLLNDTVWFGTKNPLENDDTTDNIPPGFELRNLGNSIIKVNLSLLDAGLWSRKPSPTPFYSYKITNKSGQAGAFNFSSSVTSWTSIPLSNITSITSLLYSNYSNANNTVIVDINITVPSDEPQGDKASRISFISQLI